MSTITLKELSRVSGYSVSTVSKALNNKLDISVDTRRLIKKIACKYNYIPNNSAVALRKKRTKVISVVVPQINTSFYSCFLFNIEKIAYTHGYRIVLFQSLDNIDKEREFINQSNDGSVDGIIIITKNKLFNEFSEENKIPIECVQIGNSLEENRLQKKSIMSFSKLLTRFN